MEAAALEQTLREHPDDAASWLVYGDWLLEHDDIRGALIQLEHQHARARAVDRPAVEREIDALQRKHRMSWAAALPPGVVATAWRYGFAVKVSVMWSEDAPAQIAQGLREPFVTALRIAARKADGRDEDELDEDGEPIEAAPVEIGALAGIDLSRLVELDLGYLPIAAPGAEVLAASTSLIRLEALDLRYCRIGDDGLAALARSPLAGRVRRLRLQRNGITAAGVHALQRFERLVELDLRYNEIGPEGAQALLAAPFIASLARLGLYRTDVSDAGAKELARSSRLAPALRSYWRSV